MQLHQSIKLALTITFSSLLIAPFCLAEIYKIVDEHGKVTFSDQPHPSAKAVELPTANTTPAIEIPVKKATTQTTDTDPSEFSGYQSLSISHPSDQSIIPNGLVPLSVRVNISPSLQEGHMILLEVGADSFTNAEGIFTLPRLTRGEHKLQASILDKQDQALKQSSTVTIFVYLPSSNR
jgi:hypothetical protein